MTIKIQRVLSRAKKLVKNGKIKEAKNLYETTLKDHPQNEEVKKGLAILLNIKPQQEPPRDIVQSIIDLFSNGQIKEAVIEIDLLIKEYPSAPLLFNISGAFHKSDGQLDEAVKKFKQALILKSNYAEAHYNLGVTLRELGQIDAAIQSYQNAIAIKHDYPNAHNNLGNALLDLKRFDAAVEHFEWAVAFNPEFASAYNNLGIANRLRGNTLEAIKSFDKALVIKPNYAEAANYRGIIFQDTGDHENAVKYYQKALAINPNLADAYNNIGLTEKEINNPDNAIKSFEKALSINPNFANVYYNLCGFEQYTLDNKKIAKMQSLLSSDETNQSDRINLNFALAKTNETLENQDEFFSYLHEGNRLRKDELGYSIKKSQDLFSTIREIFAKETSSINESSLNITSTKRPIFILGMPRSGTSLVEQIISSHKLVYGAGELNTLSEIFYPILENKLSNEWNENTFSKQNILLMREKYLDSLSHLNTNANIITDKAPSNFRFIGLIFSIFPDAKIIHLKRNPIATCWSIYKTKWSGDGYGFSYNINDLVDYYGLYSELMNFWHKKFPGKIYDMSYEDLTNNQEEETKKLIKYCELEWDENCLNFHKNKRAVKTASLLQVREKMYQGSSEAWKTYEAHIQHLIKGLKPYFKKN
ncbi:tetratricopeptide repeat protein [Candidatus Thioglobus sp.]|nr:tetratricopeptide repeat protein [Candidatus Thioglobus sp.]